MAADKDGPISHPPMTGMLDVVENAGGGDCLFHSLRDGLVNYDGVGRRAVNDRLHRLGLPSDASLTATHLRQAAYTVLLGSTPEIDALLGQWLLLYSAMPAELPQVACIAGKSPGSLQPLDRANLFLACMQCSTWGDEGTLVILERLLNIRVMVFANGIMQVRAFGEHGSRFKPIVYLAVDLRGNHYRGVTYRANGSDRVQWAFAESELPAILVWVAHRDCKASDLP
jgi:hypothetical protein